jgi:hypothetical protein
MNPHDSLRTAQHPNDASTANHTLRDDRLETCCAILRNAGVTDYWLGRGGELVVPDGMELTEWQWLAVRAAGLVLAGCLERQTAGWLGLV